MFIEKGEPIGVDEAIRLLGGPEKGLEKVEKSLEVLHQRREWRKAVGQEVPEGIAMEKIRTEHGSMIMVGRSDGKGGVDRKQTASFIPLDE